MNIGSTIKKYRQQKDLTQEQLAEYLNVSVSAVSQWESAKTVPDISTILSLANFFDITLDELFDRTAKEKEKAIEKYHELSAQYASRGEVKNQLALWREATQKYPGDFDCLISLAYVLELTVYSGGEPDKIEANAKECISICERILKDCKENDSRNSAIQMLVHLYSHKDLTFASEENAEKYAMMAGQLFTCREVLLQHVYFKEESAKKQQNIRHINILNYMDLLTQNLYYGKYQSEDEKIRACNASLVLWKTLIYDENYLFFHCRIEKIYLSLATSYAKLQKSAETIKALKNALYHAKCYDNLPEEETHYTSVFINEAASGRAGRSKNYTSSNEDYVMHFMKSKRFDFIRDKLKDNYDI